MNSTYCGRSNASSFPKSPKVGPISWSCLLNVIEICLCESKKRHAQYCCCCFMSHFRVTSRSGPKIHPPPSNTTPLSPSRTPLHHTTLALTAGSRPHKSWRTRRRASRAKSITPSNRSVHKHKHPTSISSTKAPKALKTLLAPSAAYDTSFQQARSHLASGTMAMMCTWSSSHRCPGTSPGHYSRSSSTSMSRESPLSRTT